MGNNFTYSDDLDDSSQHHGARQNKKLGDSHENANDSNDIVRVAGKGLVQKIKKANIKNLNLNKINVKIQQQNDIKQKVKLISKVTKSKTVTRNPNNQMNDNIVLSDKYPNKVKLAGENRTGLKVNNFFNLS